MIRRLEERLAYLATATFLFAANACAQPSASAAAPPARLSIEDMRADIAVFRTEFMGRDNSYAGAARARAEAALRNLEGRLDGLGLAAFELRLSQIVALADNGHSIAAPFVRARQFNRVPIRLAPFGSDFYVLRATTATSDLLGARLTAIDGHPIAELVDSARTLAGGEPRFRDRSAPVLLESPEQLQTMGLAKSSASATYSFVDSKGKKIDRPLSGERSDPNAPRVQSQRLFMPALLPEEEGNWRTVLDPTNAPWALQEPDVRFRWRAAPEIDGMVIELRQVVSSPGYSIAEFLTAMTTKLQAQQPKNLVVDMRVNGGGNLQTARDFMKSLPLMVGSQVFVLTSPWTFSAAISSIGYLKQAGGNRVTIMGEEVGDRLEFWAEGTGATLPHSGMVVQYATQRHDYKNGCKGYTDCHAAVVNYPIAVPSLAPDIQAPWTFEAYRAGRDPGMEAVIAALGRKS